MDWPAASPSFHAKLNPAAPKTFLSATVIFVPSVISAWSSSVVSSESAEACLLGQTSVCPGVIGMLVGNANTNSLSKIFCVCILGSSQNGQFMSNSVRSEEHTSELQSHVNLV